MGSYAGIAAMRVQNDGPTGGDAAAGPASSPRNGVADSAEELPLLKAEAEMLLAPLRAQDPVVVRALWQRFLPVVLPLLHCAFLGNQVVVDEAVLEVFLQVFRWGPSLPVDAELHVFVMRAVARTVKRLSPPPGYFP
jgi:hypothetical protein